MLIRMEVSISLLSLFILSVLAQMLAPMVAQAGAQPRKPEEPRDRCEPKLAEVCFTGVHTDLANVMNVNTSRVINVSDDYLENLCNAIDDALNCTSDVIDVDCGEADGRARFKAWSAALLNTYYELCDANLNDDKILLRTIIENLACWNASHFTLCFQQNTGLTSVQQILSLDIDKSECDKLYAAFETCRSEQARHPKGQCHRNQTSESVAIVHHLFDIFLDSTHCRHYYSSDSYGLSINKILALIFGLSLRHIKSLIE